MIHPRKTEPSVTSPEIQEDVSRDAIATAFQNAMASHLRSHVPGTNINNQTFLASDYLNQFHELAMLLEALPVDPSTFSSDLHQWHAVDYEEHFNRSKLSNKELAIAAYRRAPADVREKFDSAVARLQGEALRLVAAVGRSLDSPNDLAQTCSDAAARLRVLIDDANAIANGHPSDDERHKGERPGQITIDTLFRRRNR
ncbi:MAG: hypothetical protein AAGF48_07465 [Pseudomonadota bacterium]